MFFLDMNQWTFWCYSKNQMWTSLKFIILLHSLGQEAVDLGLFQPRRCGRRVLISVPDESSDVDLLNICFKKYSNMITTVYTYIYIQIQYYICIYLFIPFFHVFHLSFTFLMSFSWYPRHPGMFWAKRRGDTASPSMCWFIGLGPQVFPKTIGFSSFSTSGRSAGGRGPSRSLRRKVWGGEAGRAGGNHGKRSFQWEFRHIWHVEIRNLIADVIKIY